MKITLIHNPSAGGGDSSDADAMIAMIRAAGHSVAYHSSKEENWQEALKAPADLVAVAGGDGPLGKVARALADTGMPLAPLPCGTANNLAYVLGLREIPMRQLVDSWPSARQQFFDVGIARGPWGEKSFVESLGAGLFAWTLAHCDDAGKQYRIQPVDLEHEVRGARKFLSERIPEFSPRPMKIRIDEKEISGEFLLAEVMNIKSIGPHLELAPQARPDDGWLDLVLVPGEHDARLHAHFNNPDCSTTEFITHRCQRLQIECDPPEYHVDDRSWPNPKKNGGPAAPTLEVSVRARALVFLVPDFV
jgi:diacylglycerol kinase (ATP)